MSKPDSTTPKFSDKPANQGRRTFLKAGAAAAATSMLTIPEGADAQVESLKEQLERFKKGKEAAKPADPRVVPNLKNPNPYITPDRDKLASDPKTGTDATLSGFGGKAVDLDTEIPASSAAAKKAYGDLVVFLNTPARLAFSLYDTGTSLKKEYIDIIIKSKAIKINATQADEINTELKGKISAALSAVKGLGREEKAEVLGRAVRDIKSVQVQGIESNGSEAFLKILFKHLPEAKDVKVKYTAYKRMGHGPANALVANQDETPVLVSDQSIRNYLKDFTAPLHMAGGDSLVAEPPRCTPGRDKVDEIFGSSTASATVSR